MDSIDSTESPEDNKKSGSKMLPPVLIEHRASDFIALHAILFLLKVSRPLDPYIGMLYGFQKNLKSKNQ